MNRARGVVSLFLLVLALIGLVMVGPGWAQAKPELTVALSSFSTETLDPALGEQARATMAAAPNYRWLGGLPHETVRRRIQRAHLLIHASRMEGGAHVIMESVASGTPVLASAVDGNIGMLGVDYAGYFPWNDAQALAALLLRCRERGATGNALLGRLAAAVRAGARACGASPAGSRHADGSVAGSELKCRRQRHPSSATSSSSAAATATSAFCAGSP